ncbi:unnamed protein product [Caenorhabditis bovis]|uniref:C-type lectin domain-containing protein n=1 Tax=Caenorhabditis bovis TaxID=2654633 RepID=A0A8S1EQM5_9PELO|nr:unnamed protein product [Caenorhabditis bovis]
MRSLLLLSTLTVSSVVGCGGKPCHEKACPSESFQKFTRPSGHVVCLTPFKQNMRYADTGAACASLGDGVKLFGIETEEEYTFINGQIGHSWYYVAAFRNPQCQANRSVLATMPECTRDKMFHFTDGVTQGTYLWEGKWQANNPNSAFINGEYESAIGVRDDGVGDWP